jgi:hypothetical protein
LSSRRLVFALLIAGFAGLFFFPALIGLLTDWWWFQEIGYQVVFTRELVTRVLLFLVAGGLTFGLLYLNLRVGQRGLVPYPVVLRFVQSAPRVDMTAVLRRLSLPVSLTFGLLAGLGAGMTFDLSKQVFGRTPRRKVAALFDVFLAEAHRGGGDFRRLDCARERTRQYQVKLYSEFDQSLNNLAHTVATFDG